MRRRSWRFFCALLLLSAACATRPTPTAPRPAPKAVSDHSGEAFRRALEQTHALIAARAKQPAAEVPQADLRAATSIPLPIPDHPSVAQALDALTGAGRRHLQTSLDRAARYRPIIDPALREARLPEALAYLPLIESAYRPHLTSRAGAHGLWQFMPETAAEYGLRMDWWVDERSDPRRSTEAAVQYLGDLHRIFRDWPLALAAYNCGPGRVRRTLEATGANSFWELWEREALPRETRQYVPSFFAVLSIVADPEGHGFTLPPAAAAPGERAVLVEGPLSLRHLSEITGVRESELRSLNPGLRYPMLPPGRSEINLPAAVAPLIELRGATLRESDEHLAITPLRLRRGDTLANVARRLGTSVQTLMAMNGLTAESARRASTIYVPARGRELALLLAHSGNPALFYVVRKSDTLFSIARRHGLSVDELRSLNDLPTDATLHPGQRLRVSVPPTVTAGGM